MSLGDQTDISQVPSCPDSLGSSANEITASLQLLLVDEMSQSQSSTTSDWEVDETSDVENGPLLLISGTEFQSLPRDVFVERLLSETRCDVVQLERLRKSLFNEAKQMPTFPGGSLTKRKKSRTTTGDLLDQKLARDCYVMSQFLRGSPATELGDIISGSNKRFKGITTPKPPNQGIDMHDQLASLQADLLALKTTVAPDKDSMKKSLTKVINVQKSEIKSLKSDLETYKAKCDKLETSIDELTSAQGSATSKVKDLRARIDKHIATFETHATSTENRIKLCKAKTSDIEKGMADIRASIERMKEPGDAEVSSVKSSLKQLKERTLTLERDVAAHTESLASNTNSITGIRTKVTHLCKNYTEVEQKWSNREVTPVAPERQVPTRQEGVRVHELHYSEGTMSVPSYVPNTLNKQPPGTVGKPVAGLPKANSQQMNRPRLNGVASSSFERAPNPRASPQLHEHTLVSTNSRDDTCTMAITTHFPRKDWSDQVPALAAAKSVLDRGSRRRPTQKSGQQDNNSGFTKNITHRVKRYYVGNINPCCTELSLLQHIQSQGVNPTYMRLIKNSKDDSVLGAQLNVHPSDSDTVESPSFWPSRIYLRPWFPKRRQP